MKTAFTLSVMEWITVTAAPWSTWASWKVPCPWQGAGTTSSLMSLPSQAIPEPWFYDTWIPHDLVMRQWNWEHVSKAAAGAKPHLWNAGAQGCGQAVALRPGKSSLDARNSGWGETLGKKTGIIRVLCEGAITRVVIWNRTETGYQQKLFKLQQNLNKCRKSWHCRLAAR